MLAQSTIAKDDFTQLADHVRETFAASMRLRNVTAAAESYAPEAWLIPPQTDVLRGRDAIAAYWQAGLDAGIDDFSFLVDGVDLYDSVAVEFGRYVASLGLAEDRPIAEHGHYVSVYVRQPDGDWRWASQLMSPHIAGGGNNG